MARGAPARQLPPSAGHPPAQMRPQPLSCVRDVRRGPGAISSAHEFRDPPRPRGRAAHLPRVREHGLSRPARRGQAGGRGRAAVAGRPGLGRLRGRPCPGQLPIVGHRADRAGGRTAARGRCLRRDGRANHRRRGILRSMVATEHDAIREHGDAVGLLYASEYPIYGRFGYGPAIRVGTWTLDTRGTSFHGEVAGCVDVVKPDPEARGPSRPSSTRGGSATRARSGGATIAGSTTWGANPPGASAGRDSSPCTGMPPARSTATSAIGRKRSGSSGSPGRSSTSTTSRP